MRFAACLSLVLLAACVETDPDQPRATYEETATDPDYPGLVVAGTLFTEGRQHRIEAEARNEGPHTFEVSSICFPVWAHHVEDASQQTIWPEPQVHCEAYGKRDFKPGGASPFRTWWNETRWDSTHGTRSAATGDHTWAIVFHAGFQGRGIEHPAVQLSFRVPVA